MSREKVRLSESVEWVGAVDWNIRGFHGYTTRRGTSCNSYLVKGERIAPVDTVKSSFAGETARKLEG